MTVNMGCKDGDGPVTDYSESKGVKSHRESKKKAEAIPVTSSLMEPNDGRRTLLDLEWESEEWVECGDESLEWSCGGRSQAGAVVNRERAGFCWEEAGGVTDSMMATRDDGQL